MEFEANIEDTQSMSLIELPEDVLQGVCQHLFHVTDLARLASCCRACRDVVRRPELWEALLITRFGEDSLHSSSLNSTALRAVYVKKSRTTVPALEIGALHLGTQYLIHDSFTNSTYGQVLLLKHVCWLDINATFHAVLPGEYQIVWRMMKVDTRNIGWGDSPVMMSVDAQEVHPSTTCSHESDINTREVQQNMQQFNNLPVQQWVDVPGGSIHIRDFSDVTARLWCHSGDWKSGLAWDYVRLKDINQPVAVEPQVRHAMPSSAAAAASSFVRRVQSAADDCTIQ